MIRATGIIAFTMSMLAAGHVATAAEYGAPLIDKHSSVIIGVENMMSDALRPLDAVTQPVSDLTKPVTGSAGFSTSRSAEQPVPDSGSADGAARTRKSLTTEPPANPK